MELLRALALAKDVFAALDDDRGVVHRIWRPGRIETGIVVVTVARAAEAAPSWTNS